MEVAEIKRRIDCCIGLFYANDSDLLSRENYEVTTSSKLAQYLVFHFPEYQVDCEYNKHIDERKENEGKNIRPDIVIHKRGTDEKNLVYIEIKTDHNRDDKTHDMDKIKSVTKQDREYRYKLGVFIDFYREK